MYEETTEESRIGVYLHFNTSIHSIEINRTGSLALDMGVEPCLDFRSTDNRCIFNNPDCRQNKKRQMVTLPQNAKLAGILKRIPASFYVYRSTRSRITLNT